ARRAPANGSSALASATANSGRAWTSVLTTTSGSNATIRNQPGKVTRIHSRFRKGGKGYRNPGQPDGRGGLHCLPLRTHKESLGQTQLLIRKAPARARKKEKEGRKSRPQARR